jgi:ABC-2 type transport system permease protein
VTWQVVARKDFRDAIRSRWLLGLGIFFLVIIAGTTGGFYFFIADVTGGEAELTSRLLYGTFIGTGLISLSYTGLLAFVLAFLALVSSYNSLVGERESGTLKLLLALPHDRRDLVVGKLLGRSAVVVLPVLVGFVLAVLLMIAAGARVQFDTFLPQVGLTALLAVTFVSIGVGVSAATGSGRRATLTSLGLYFVLSLLWSLIAQGVPRIVTEARKLVGMDALSSAASLKLRLFVKYLNPMTAYETIVAQVYFGADGSETAGLQARLIKEGQAGQLQAIQAFRESPETLPVYLSVQFIFFVLLAWTVLPPILGYLAFRDADL